MMVLKILGITLGILALVVLFGYFFPAKLVVERKTLINAPRWSVYEEVVDLKRFNQWSPWEEIDPKTEHKFFGEKGVGQVYMWKSKNKSVSEGSMQIVHVEEDYVVEQDLYFGNVDKATSESAKEFSRVTFLIEPKPEGSEVRWKFRTDAGMNPIMRYIQTFKMKSVLTEQYDKGLLSLKALVEAKPSVLTPIEHVDEKPLHYLGIRVEVEGSNYEKEMGKGFEKLHSLVPRYVKGKDYPVSAAFYGPYDEQQRKHPLVCAVILEDSIQLRKDETELVKGFWKGGRSARGTHKGPYISENFSKSHRQIRDHLQARGLKLNGDVVEKYVVGPGGDVDSTQYVTEFYYPVIEE